MRSSKDDETQSVAETLNNRLPSAVIENSQNEIPPNREAIDDLYKRVEDWKGHDPAAFRDLLLHGELDIVSSTQPAKPRKVTMPAISPIKRLQQSNIYFGFTAAWKEDQIYLYP